MAMKKFAAALTEEEIEKLISSKIPDGAKKKEKCTMTMFESYKIIEIKKMYFGR